MDRKKKIGIILLILIILGILFFVLRGPIGPAGTETKIEMYNNGTTWIHVVMAFENETMKNGSKTTFYVDAWIKPRENDTSSVESLPGKVTINLSDLLGYGNQAIPNGTNIPVKIWLNPSAPGVNESTQPKGNINFIIQGWSNTPNPPANPKLVTVKAVDPEIYNFEFLNTQVYPLPADIKDNKITITEDPSKFAMTLSGMGTVQYLNLVFLDVDEDEKLIIDRNSLLNLGPITTNHDGSITIDTRSNPRRTIGPNTLCIITA